MKIRLTIFLTCFAAATPLMQAPADAQTIVVDNASFRSVYDLQLSVPRQVEWTLHRTDIGKSQREPSWLFSPDIRSARAVARHDDYNRSGYDRGHMCPAQDRSTTVSAMRSTFVMSNIAPQLPSLNRGSWKRTENFCRAAAEVHDSICIVAVPLFLDRDTMFIGRHRLAVPHAFFKAAWLASNDSIIGCWFFFNH